MSAEPTAELRGAIRWAAILNLGSFGFEFAIAIAIASVSLFADSIDFLEDGAVNILILLAFTWSARARARTGMALAAILLAPAVATLWTAVEKIRDPVAPEALPLTLTGFGALAVNATCTFILRKYRRHPGSLIKAAFLSARNDVIANGAIIVAGLLTAAVGSIWPDLVAGAGIFWLNLHAANDVFRAAHREHIEARP